MKSKERKDEIIKEIYNLSVDLYFLVKEKSDKRGHCGLMGFGQSEIYQEDLSHIGGAIGNLKMSFDSIKKQK